MVKNVTFSAIILYMKLTGTEGLSFGSFKYMGVITDEAKAN